MTRMLGGVVLVAVAVGIAVHVLRHLLCVTGAGEVLGWVIATLLTLGLVGLRPAPRRQ